MTGYDKLFLWSSKRADTFLISIWLLGFFPVFVHSEYFCLDQLLLHSKNSEIEIVHWSLSTIDKIFFSTIFNHNFCGGGAVFPQTDRRDNQSLSAEDIWIYDSEASAYWHLDQIMSIRENLDQMKNLCGALSVQVLWRNYIRNTVCSGLVEPFLSDLWADWTLKFVKAPSDLEREMTSRESDGMDLQSSFGSCF